MPDGRRRAPFSPPSATITGERDRFRPLAPPVAVWAAFLGGVAGSGPRRRGRAPWAGCGLGVGRAGGSWAASSTSRRYCGTKTDTTSPEGPACAKTSGSAGAVDDSGVVGSVWPCDVAQRSCAHGPVPGAGETPPAGGVSRPRHGWPMPSRLARARVRPRRPATLPRVPRVADRSVRVVWARPAAHRRAVSGHRPAPLTRWCVVRGGGAARCAGRRCRPGARACGAPAPAAPDTRRAGRRPRAVPVR